MSEERFFEERTEQSEIKTEIVRKYFWAWAKVISKQVKKWGKNKIGYMDLFSGPGRYDDNSKSTPLLILEGAIRENDLREMLVAVFNDADSENTRKLQGEINNLPNIGLLKNKPVVKNIEVSDELAEALIQTNRIPTLYFLDPFGYKGISLKLIQTAIQSWGCDCMFFFNYNRINAALSNPVMENNMNLFFGQSKADGLRLALKNKTPNEREQIIIIALKETLAEMDGKYAVEYFFKDENSKKTSHFLIFVSKNVLGYNIMKSIMASESSRFDEGIASFGYNPDDKAGQMDLFSTVHSPIDALADELLTAFAGQTMTAQEVFYQHNLGKNLIWKNYQDALRKLEETNKIIANPNNKERRKIGDTVTFGENVLISFPEK